MKKVIAVIVGIIVLSVSGLAIAKMDKMDKGMDHKEGMMGMMKMCHTMMNKPSIVAVGDGVVVLSGQKLYKYDANLILVKEADLKKEDMGMMDMSQATDKTPTKEAEHAGHH